MPSLLRTLSISRNRFGLVAFLFCLFAPIAARADNQDVVHFGDNITIQEGEEAHDAVCFLCSIQIDGTVHGDTVAFLGNIHIRGHAEHDAVAFLGNISLGDDASIGHDVVVFAGSLHLGSGATIGKDRVVFPLFLLFLPLLFLVGFVALIVWGVRALVYRNRTVYPMPPPRF